jgi:hypothetical protein
MAQMNAMAQGNAPKELYQQGGPPGMAGGGMGPDLGSLTPEEMGALDELPNEGWVDQQIGEVPQPAEPGGLEALLMQ